MTSKDFIEAEAGNNGSIILYRKGLFWKAYEKSSYAVCTQIKPLKAIKRRLKSLGGGEIVSVGFPCKHEQKYIGSLEHMETMLDRLVLRTLKPIDEQRFEEWKQVHRRRGSYPCNPSPLRRLAIHLILIFCIPLCLQFMIHNPLIR